MEAAVVSSVLRVLGPKIFTFLQKNHKLRADLELNIQFVKDELRMIAAAIEEHEGHSLSDGISNQQRVQMEVVRELAYSMEDIIDRFLYRVSLEAGASWLRRKSHGLTTTLTRAKFAAKIQKLREASQEAFRLKQNYTAGSGQSSNSGPSVSTLPSDGDTPPDDLVDMDVPRNELLELIREDDGQPKQLKVISIVGFGGLGKTVLARQVYNSASVCKEYKPRVWVPASKMGAGDVLKEISRQVHDGSSSNLRECLRSRRFFIVIDDMRTEYWNTIKNFFPKDVGFSSRVIVTTPIQSIANACSAGNGHVYVVRPLDMEHSTQLFFKEACFDYYEPAEPVVKKCDGLPLALITTAQLLQSKDQLTPDGCADLCRSMGDRVEKEDTLARLKHVLLQSYFSLPGHNLRACLLYLSIFPCEHPVKRKRLIRRWLAERFVEDPVVAIQNFNLLLDRSIIKHVGGSNNMEAKKCQTQGMMLEFIRQKSMCENFITLYHQASLPDKVRWLSLHHNSGADKPKTDIDLSLVRSLTVFGKADQHVLQFSKYKLLHVLDLEECEALIDEDVKNICNLLLLRYLSLGGEISKLPNEIAKLKFLETLDVRGARAKSLPICIEVIKLPCLIHLFGVFSLPDVDTQMGELQTFLSEKSNMETLAGFIADQSSAFPALMSHMNRLKKVKVFCEPTANDNLSGPLQKFIQRGTKANDGRSLSVSFEGCSHDFLKFRLVQNSIYLSSLKLHGELSSLPSFVTDLGSVTELCLSTPDKLSMDLLAALSNVRALHYLKLIAKQLDRFVIKHGELKNLRRLCIVVQSMTCLENHEGALPQLESILLLCKGLNGLCGATIEHLRRLKEVTLDEVVSEETKKDWEEAAKKHQNRPRVLLLGTKEVEQTEVSESPAAPEVVNIKRLVHKGSEAHTMHKKSSGKLVLFGSGEANGSTSTAVSCDEKRNNGITN